MQLGHRFFVFRPFRNHPQACQFLQDGWEGITTKKVTIEANAYNTPAVLQLAGDEENLFVLMPMHIDGW